MFSLSFWKSTAEATVTTFATAFAGTFLAQGKYTTTALVAAASAGGLAALAVFVKQLGAVQAAAGVPKVSLPAPKAVAK